MSEEMIIGGVSIVPGTVTSIDLPIADLYTATSLSMPVKVFRGRRPGPVLLVSAALHGDELNGVEIIRRLTKRKLLEKIRGTLIAVPVVNVHGFLNQSRYLPDRRDLNRSFPGSPRGSIASRMAHIFVKELVSLADIGIDLHTGAINRSNFPQIRAELSNPYTLELANVFGAPVVVDSPLRDGSLRSTAGSMEIPMLVYEAGEALRFDDLAIRAGLRGIINILRHTGMLPTSGKTIAGKPVLAESTSWVRAPGSGIVSGKAVLGSTVTAGQVIASVSDPLGEGEESVLAPYDGLIIGRNNLPLAHEGEALFNIAAFKSVEKAENRVEEFAAAHAPESDSVHS